MMTHGYQMASFEVLRRYLQTVTNEQIDFGMKHFLTEEDINMIRDRKHPRFNAIQMLNPVLLMRVASQMDLAKGLRYTADKSQALVDLNLQYPESPKGFPEWKKKMDTEMDETKKRLIPKGAAA
jgi:digeranylgeranylglycerophospholipid reductase